MIKIRLQRKGRIRRPIYHIVVADSRSPRDGRIIERVGRYDGVTEKKETTINEERISYWLDNGAKPTDAVEKILRHEGFLYKRHLQMWGKSEEEITAALEGWKAARKAKEKTEVTRKKQVRATLIAEEKEVKKQIEQKASAAAEMAQEAKKTVETEVAEATENEVSEESAPELEVEAKVEVTTEKAPSEEEAVVAEETESPDAEAGVEQKTEESTEAVSEEVESTTAEDAAPVEQPEETSAETRVESVRSSADMTAKDAADHIAATPLEDLEGFVSDGEERKTVLAAWETKKEA